MHWKHRLNFLATISIGGGARILRRAQNVCKTALTSYAVHLAQSARAIFLLIVHLHTVYLCLYSCRISEHKFMKLYVSYE
ncbi:unnamed protein product [Cylicocyclus nassatus]|uniref:Uncharacterized protein n=1 Tax=Cylicocyclus nassatus TaxID=53992 RepID=A0AA36MBJ0_CYLNA|nr:unnamed protein product [Cylicocyclus nassatus]